MCEHFDFIVSFAKRTAAISLSFHSFLCVRISVLVVASTSRHRPPFSHIQAASRFPAHTHTSRAELFFSHQPRASAARSTHIVFPVIRPQKIIMAHGKRSSKVFDTDSTEFRKDFLSHGPLYPAKRQRLDDHEDDENHSHSDKSLDLNMGCRFSKESHGNDDNGNGNAKQA